MDVAVELLMFVKERCAIVAVTWTRHRQIGIEPLEADVERSVHFDKLSGDSLRKHFVSSGLCESIEGCFQVGDRFVCVGPVNAGCLVSYDIGHACAESAQDARVWMIQDLANPQLFRNGTRVLRCGSPKGNEHIVTRVIPFCDRDRSNRLGHVRIRDLKKTVSEFDRSELTAGRGGNFVS